MLNADGRSEIVQRWRIVIYLDDVLRHAGSGVSDANYDVAFKFVPKLHTEN